jgi:uncharacterized caspase-like protein
MSIVEANENYTKKVSQQVILTEGNNTFYAITDVGGKTFKSNTFTVNYTPNKPQVVPITKTETRLALVMSNAKYSVSGASLANANNDSRDMQKALEGLGFEVILAQDMSKQGFEEKVNEFTKKLENYDVGFFYYAGHGIEVNKNNYLCPDDVPKIENFTEADVPYKCVRFDWIQDKMHKAGATGKTNIIVLDACRNNPLTRSFRSLSTESVWAPNYTIPTGFITLFAASQGEKASDGNAGNGLLTSVLLKYLKKPNVEIERLFKEVRVEVTEKNKGLQKPESSSQLNKDF